MAHRWKNTVMRMKKLILLLFLAALTIVARPVSAQLEKHVGIGTNTPDNSAILELLSTTQGLLIPYMTETQKNAIASPALSLLIYQTNTNTLPSWVNLPTTFWYHDGVIWRPLLSLGTAWSIYGNANTTPGTNFLGTTDAVDMKFRTNNTHRATITSGGNVGINNASPTEKLDVAGTFLIANNNNTPGQLRFHEPSGSGANITSLRVRPQSADIAYTLPDTQGGVRTQLTNTGAQTLFWDYYSRTPEFTTSDTLRISGNQNNMALDDNTTLFRICPAANYDLTGIAGGRNGRMVIIANICSGGNIILKEEDANSTAANRLLLSASQFSLGVNEASMFVYDGTSLRWRLVAKTP
jgi:hypothetical protein